MVDTWLSQSVSSTYSTNESNAHTSTRSKQVHRFDVVITSGGVGATHDDVTIKGSCTNRSRRPATARLHRLPSKPPPPKTTTAVAAALGQGISENDEMIRRIQEAYGVGSREELTDGAFAFVGVCGLWVVGWLGEPAKHRRGWIDSTSTHAHHHHPHTKTNPHKTAQKSMALLPDLARLRVAPNAPSKVWPILQCENVFILPGCVLACLGGFGGLLWVGGFGRSHLPINTRAHRI